MDNGIDINSFNAGSEAVFKSLIKEHGVALRFFAYKMLKDKAQSEDIVSETFAKLWIAREKFISFEKIHSFLYTVTKNACLDYLGSLQQRMTSTTEIPDQADDGYTDVLTGMIHAEMIGLVHEELKNIPSKYASIFKMTYLEGLSTDEVCKELGITPSAVFTGKSKALSHLQKVFRKKNPLYLLALYTLIN